ncbi:GFA family protein [Mesorhizobium yinganensis]|uniref:GFA family protein n=1 Tax=Mesorhizobium yinganensis TaxID=3157707 RepID=UPI0032B7B56C
MFSSKAEITWLSGQDRVKTYSIPATRHEKSFCSECGSALPRVQDGFVVAPAGSLDSAVPIKPNAHICCASRAEWDERLEEVPKIDGLPG